MQIQRQQLEDILADRRATKRSEEQNTQKEMELQENLQTHKEVLEVFKEASIYTQNHLEVYLSDICTKAIRAVFFEKDIKFVVKFVERRNTSECDMYVVDSELGEFDVLDDRGHGLADIVSIALRMAYISLSNNDKVLLLDEPTRNLDIEREPYGSQMIKDLSKELGMQFIIVTHKQGLVESADTVYKVKQVDKISYAEKLK